MILASTCRGHTRHLSQRHDNGKESNKGPHISPKQTGETTVNHSRRVGQKNDLPSTLDHGREHNHSGLPKDSLPTDQRPVRWRILGTTNIELLVLSHTRHISDIHTRHVFDIPVARHGNSSIVASIVDFPKCIVVELFRVHIISWNIHHSYRFGECDKKGIDQAAMWRDRLYHGKRE